jgi:hypothetical protein
LSDFQLSIGKGSTGCRIQTNGTIFYKSVQLLAYADDIDIIARSPTTLKEAFLSLERAARVMGLKINEEKTKYMTAILNKNQTKYFQIEKFNFEIVQFYIFGLSGRC